MTEQENSPGSEEIDFEQVQGKEVRPVVDPNTREMRDQVIKKIERQQTEQEVRGEMGLDDEPKGAPVPKEIPWLMFRFGAKTIKCEKFNLDDEEANVFAKHLSVVCEALHIKGWMWSLVIITLILVSKLIQCKEAIMALFVKKQEAPA